MCGSTHCASVAANDNDNYAAVADLGAQVLSVVVTDNNHADAGEGGHGIRADALSLASDEAWRMVNNGVLIEVDGDWLGETEERMLWEGIWKHYCSRTVEDCRACCAETWTKRIRTMSSSTRCMDRGCGRLAGGTSTPGRRGIGRSMAWTSGY